MEIGLGLEAALQCFGATFGRILGRGEIHRKIYNYRCAEKSAEHGSPS
jgi:hypothetical protein